MTKNNEQDHSRLALGRNRRGSGRPPKIVPGQIEPPLTR